MPTAHLKLIREFCADNDTNIPVAVRNGADRIELCDRVDLGGLTPSPEVMTRALTYCAAHGNVPVMVLIRPHARSFVYSDDDVQVMCGAISEARRRGAAGVVIGALTPDGKIDRAVTDRLLDAAHGLQVTFHMAFDAIVPAAAQLSTELPWLREQAEKGRLHRLLTHGSSFGATPAVPIEANLPYLKQVVEAAGPVLRVVPGGGVTAENAETVAAALGVTEVHGTRIVDMTSA